MSGSFHRPLRRKSGEKYLDLECKNSGDAVAYAKAFKKDFDFVSRASFARHTAPTPERS